MLNIGAAWREVRDRFRRGGVETPDLDARLLAEAAFGMGRLELSSREREDVSPEGVARLESLARRRLAGEPVSRILGEKEFFGLSFALDESTLVPRPETELVVYRTLALIVGRPSKRILDLGTGTGAIPIAVLSEEPDATAVAVDVAPDAIAMARTNAERHGVIGRLDLRVGSWFEPIAENERFDVIVSNPPYIESKVIETLAPEVRDHDPRLALDGGPDGLDAYRAILAAAAQHLNPQGAIVFEIGAGQGEAVRNLCALAGFEDVNTEKDLAGLDRVVTGHHF